MQQDARIATHTIQFSPGGTPIGVEVGRGCSKVVPISKLRMDKAEKKTGGFNLTSMLKNKSKGAAGNVLGADAEAKMAERKAQREKLRELRERTVPMDVMEDDGDENAESPRSPAGGKGKIGSLKRAALATVDSNSGSPLSERTEKLAEELLEAPKQPEAEPAQMSPAQQRPSGCSSQSPLGSPKVSPKGASLEERYNRGQPTSPLRFAAIGIPPPLGAPEQAVKKTKKKKGGFSVFKTNRRGERISQEEGAALAVAAMQSTDPLRQSFLLRTIEEQQEELRRTSEAMASAMDAFQAKMDANTREMEEQANKAASLAAAEFEQQVLVPMAARAAAAHASPQQPEQQQQAVEVQAEAGSVAEAEAKAEEAELASQIVLEEAKAATSAESASQWEGECTRNLRHHFPRDSSERESL